MFDLRAGRLNGAVKGAMGSIRALALHPTEPIMACVGLDRYARLFSTTTRKPLAKVLMYLVSPRHCLNSQAGSQDISVEFQNTPMEGSLFECGWKGRDWAGM